LLSLHYMFIKILNMWKLNFLIFLLVIGTNSYTQSYTIEYEVKANIENQLKNVTDPETRKRVTAYLSKPNTFYLYYNNGESIFIQEKEKKDSSEELSLRDDKNKRLEIGKNNGGVYKNYKTGEYLQEVDVVGKRLLVVDKLEKYEWLLIDEGKKIGDFNCKKATATINNEQITAWYTEDIALQEGPKDYYGLPGLIVELIAEKKTYMAIKIIENKAQISIAKPSNGTVVNKKEYRKILDDKLNELKRGSRPQGN
jgi:GLPGLI family protein